MAALLLNMRDEKVLTDDSALILNQLEEGFTELPLPNDSSPSLCG